MDEKVRNVSLKKRIIIIAVIAAAAVALIVFLNYYLGRADYFSEHFFDGTVVNGTDSSELTASEVVNNIQADLNKYSFTFTDHEGRSSTLNAEDIDLTYIDDGEVEHHLDVQNNMGWIFDNGKTTAFTVITDYTYDNKKLDSWIDALPCLNDGTPSKDAYKKEVEDGYQEIVPEIKGDQIYADKLKDLIVEQVNTGGTALKISDDALFIQPEVTADDKELNEEVEANNQARDDYYDELRRQQHIEEITDLDLKLNSYIDKVYINQELLKGMLTEDEKGNPAIDEDMFKDWVRNWAIERGFTENPNLFVTHGGRLMQVSYGPYRGWSLDLEATVEKAWKAVKYGDKGVIHPVLVDSEGNLQTKSTYVEINKMKQKMWLYVNGEQIVETPVVTGNESRGMGTPTNGVWRMDRINHHYTMVGADYVAYCDYWMAFNGGIGIHDLATRHEYGGEIYKTAGSHGCVNTPYEAAQTIFSYAYIGLPVVVHS